MRTCVLMLSACSIAILAGCGGGAPEPDKTPLTTKVLVILKENCHRCHGEGGSPDADFYVLDHESLLARSVVPGKPEDSRLFAKVASGEMPLNADPLSVADQETLRRWIAGGAPDFNPPPAERSFITPQQILEILQADLNHLPGGDRSFARYFSITHLYNAGLHDDRLETYRGALSRLVNSLSWQTQVVPPRAVDPSRTLYRIDLRNYRWSPDTWETIAAADPYGITHDTAVEMFCRTATGTVQPLVRVDWFLSAAARPPLYYDVLQLPATDVELETALRVNVSENIRNRRVARAGLTVSQAAEHNRLIERHHSPLTRGAYWKTYDFASEDGARNLANHPLGPKGHAENAFEHDGSEIAFQLPNGLQAYLVVDGRGNRLDTPLVGTLQDRKGQAVITGVSCMSCHAGGVIGTDDEVRQQVQGGLNAYRRGVTETVLALYSSQKEFAELQQKDALRFADAVIQTGARLADRDPIATLAQRYEDNLNLRLAAAEAGVPPDTFLAGLVKSPAMRRKLGALEGVGGTVPRRLFLKSFAALVRELRLGTPISRSHAQ